MAAGVDRPRLYILPDGHPRAFAVGRGRGSAAVALSQGLVTLSRPAELEGLLAHELAHIRHRDVVVQTPVVVLAGWLLEASRIGGLLERALLFVLAPVAASLVQVLLSPKREFAADAAAARYCNSPHGLADALVRLEQAQELVSSGPARPPSPSTRSIRSSRGSRGALHDPPSGRRARGAPARPRSRLAREAACGLTTAVNAKGPLKRGPFESNPAASYSPGRLPSEYHRRWRA